MNKEQEKYIKELRKFGKKLIASKEEAKKFLKRVGIHTNTGRLTKRYRNRDNEKTRNG